MTTFTFVGPGTDDELGVWQPLPPAAVPREPSSGLLEAMPAEASPPDAFVWQVAFSADQARNQRDLADAGQRLDAADAAIPWAARRLHGFVRGQPIQADQPEVELASWAALARPAGPLEAWEDARPADDALLALPDFQATAAQTSAFFGKLRESLRHLAVVRTTFDGLPAAHTVVTWTGDYRTAWQAGVTGPQAALHLQAVSVSMRTRDAWLRLGTTTVASAAQLAALFAANPLLALPAAYRFVRRIIAQLQALQLQPVPTT